MFYCFFILLELTNAHTVTSTRCILKLQDTFLKTCNAMNEHLECTDLIDIVDVVFCATSPASLIVSRDIIAGMNCHGERGKPPTAPLSDRWNSKRVLT